MSNKQPLTTENYHYKLDEAHRKHLLAQAEHDRLAASVHTRSTPRRLSLPNPLIAAVNLERQVQRVVRECVHWAVNHLRGHRIKGA